MVLLWSSVLVPDPDSQSETGGQKWPTKNRKKVNEFNVLKCSMSSFEGWRLLL
jgi:hypothetical protein